MSLSLYDLQKHSIVLSDLLWPFIVFLWSFIAFYSIVYSIFMVSCGLFIEFMAKYWSDWTFIVFSRGHTSKFFCSCFVTLCIFVETLLSTYSSEPNIDTHGILFFPWTQMPSWFCHKNFKRLYVLQYKQHLLPLQEQNTRVDSFWSCQLRSTHCKFNQLKSRSP